MAASGEDHLLACKISSLQIERVMLNFVFRRPFSYSPLLSFSCGNSGASSGHLKCPVIIPGTE